MDESAALDRLQSEMHDELVGHILPFWMTRTLDRKHEGFVGRIAGDGAVVDGAAKGSVLNARILWTFSAAARLLGSQEYLRVADRAFGYLTRFFLDDRCGGVYWTVDHEGRPLDTRKHVYAQAFAVYGLCEYARATGSAEALEAADGLYRLIEARCADAVHGGYHEARTADWQPLADVRLSDKDADAAKSMNTHLHVLEAYTSLYRVRPAPDLGERLSALVELFLTRILDADQRHLVPFFTCDWTPVSRTASFGHDAEASWLLLEAADALGDARLRACVAPAALALARSTLEEGLGDDGGVLYEARPDGTLDADRHWWPQAEAVVGFVGAYRETGAARFLEAAGRVWDYTRRHVVDRTGGEWFFRVDGSGRPYGEEDKAGLWKCPYHNARACLEVLVRAGS